MSPLTLALLPGREVLRRAGSAARGQDAGAHRPPVRRKSDGVLRGRVSRGAVPELRCQDTNSGPVQSTCGHGLGCDFTAPVVWLRVQSVRLLFHLNYSFGPGRNKTQLEGRARGLNLRLPFPPSVIQRKFNCPRLSVPWLAGPLVYNYRLQSRLLKIFQINLFERN